MLAVRQDYGWTTIWSHVDFRLRFRSSMENAKIEEVYIVATFFAHGKSHLLAAGS